MKRSLLLLLLVLTAVTSPSHAETEPSEPHAVQTPSFQVPPGQRQLFLDDVGVSKTQNLSRTLHQPEKRGAVIRPDGPWESTLQTRCAPVWDPVAKRFKLWMITSTTIPGLAEMTYAESEDGLQWSKPILRQKSVLDSLENNVVTLDPAREWGSNAIENVVYDHHDPDPARRFKGFANVYSREPIVSPDGLHWTSLDVPALDSQDESNLCYDPVTRTFIATLKTNGPFGRSQAIWTSPDFETWTNTEVLFHADERDQALGKKHVAARIATPALHQTAGLDASECKVDIYNLGISRYEGLYLGFPALFHQSGAAGFHLVQLASSRDLKTWNRVAERATFLGPSTVVSGAYDRTQILPPSGPVLRDDELWFYYSGIKYRLPPEGVKEVGAICLAILRRDGFVSMDAGNQEGTLLTEPIVVTTSRLFVNVDASQGELRAEVLDMDGVVVALSRPVMGDNSRVALRWVQGDLATQVGRKVQLRFTLRDAAFYSYWLGHD